MSSPEYILREHLVTAAHAQFPYIVSEVTLQVSTTSNKIPCGGTGATGSRQSIISTAAPITRKLLTFTLVRLNAVPDLPYITSIYKNNSTDVVETSDIQVAAPVLHQDGVSTIYQVSGAIQYISNEIYDPATSVVPYPLSPADGNRQNIPLAGGGGANNTVHHGGNFNAVWPFVSPDSPVNLNNNSATNNPSTPTDTIGE